MKQYVQNHIRNLTMCNQINIITVVFNRPTHVYKFIAIERRHCSQYHAVGTTSL